MFSSFVPELGVGGFVGLSAAFSFRVLFGLERLEVDSGSGLGFGFWFRRGPWPLGPSGALLQALGLGVSHEFQTLSSSTHAILWSPPAASAPTAIVVWNA